MQVTPYFFIPVIFIGVIFCIVFTYVWYFDLSIDAETYAKGRSCEQLKYFLDTDGKKIMKNIFATSVKKIYDERNCSLEAKP